MERDSVIPLPTSFTKLFFNHEQVERNGRVAIFKRWKTGQSHHYEVVIVRPQAAWICQGKEIPAKEAYPNSEQWGQFGWTYKTLEEAKAKAATLK